MGYLGSKMKLIATKFGYDLEVIKRPRKWFRIPADIENINPYLEELIHLAVLRCCPVVGWLSVHLHGLTVIDG